MLSEAKGQYKFAGGGMVIVRELVGDEFPQRIAVVETAREIVWTSRWTILIKSRRDGATKVYEFDASVEGRKMYVKVLLALVANGASSAPSTNGGSGGLRGAPAISVEQPRKPPKSVDKSPLWHLSDKNLKA